MTPVRWLCPAATLIASLSTLIASLSAGNGAGAASPGADGGTRTCSFRDNWWCPTSALMHALSNDPASNLTISLSFTCPSHVIRQTAGDRLTNGTWISFAAMMLRSSCSFRKHHVRFSFARGMATDSCNAINSAASSSDTKSS